MRISVNTAMLGPAAPGLPWPPMIEYYALRCFLRISQFVSKHEIGIRECLGKR